MNFWRDVCTNMTVTFSEDRFQVSCRNGSSIPERMEFSLPNSYGRSSTRGFICSPYIGEGILSDCDAQFVTMLFQMTTPVYFHHSTFMSSIL
jgi:hypothetical protein